MRVLPVLAAPCCCYAAPSPGALIQAPKQDEPGAALVLEAHGQTVTSIAFSPDGRRLLSSSFDNTVRCWDTRYGARLWSAGRFIFPGLHITAHAHAVAWRPDGRLAAYGNHSCEVAFIDPATGQDVLKWAAAAASIRCLAWSPDGSQLAASSMDGTVAFWRSPTGERIGEPVSIEATGWSLAWIRTGANWPSRA